MSAVTIGKLQSIIPGPWERVEDDDDEDDSEEDDEVYLLEGDLSVINVTRYGNKWDATVIGRSELNCQFDAILCDSPELAVRSLMRRVHAIGELIPEKE